MTTLKVRHSESGEIRLWTHAEAEGGDLYAALLHALPELFHMEGGVRICHLDQDGDLVTLSSTQQLQEAIAMQLSLGRHTVLLQVLPSGVEKQPQPQAAQPPHHHSGRSHWHSQQHAGEGDRKHPCHQEGERRHHHGRQAHHPGEGEHHPWGGARWAESERHRKWLHPLGLGMACLAAKRMWTPKRHACGEW